MAWNTANDAVLAEGKRVLINDPGRFEDVTTIGVDWGSPACGGARLAPHKARRQVRHRDHRPHPNP